MTNEIMCLHAYTREVGKQRSAAISYFNVTYPSSAVPISQSVPCNMQRMQKAYHQILMILFLPYHLEYISIYMHDISFSVCMYTYTQYITH